MEKVTEEEVQEISRSFSSTNRSPYDNDPFHGGMYPQTIYFYYWDKVNPDAEPEPPAFIFEYPQPIRNQVRLAELIRRAGQRVADGKVRPNAIGFDKFNWRRKSFIVILIADPAWAFMEGRAIKFYQTNGGKGNHSFFDAFHPEVRIAIDGVARDVSVLCFTNWMVDASGSDLGVLQEEKFEFYLYVNGPRGLFSTEIDPGGTNLGPPVGPP